MSLKTIGVTQEIVSRLGLDTECFHKGAFHNELAYGINLPVKVKFTDIAESDDASMRLELQADSTVRISDLHLNNRPLEGTFTFKLGKTVKTPMGKISVLPSLNYVGGSKDNLLVIRRPLRETCNDINARIQARQRDAKASIIDFYFDDVVAHTCRGHSLDTHQRLQRKLGQRPQPDHQLHHRLYQRPTRHHRVGAGQCRKQHLQLQEP